MKFQLRLLILSFLFIQSYGISLSEEVYLKDKILTPDSVNLFKLKDDISGLSIEARVAVTDNKERNGYSSAKWGVVWNYKSKTDYNAVELTWKNTNYGDVLDERQAEVRVIEVRNNKITTIKTKTLKTDINLSRGFNTILVEVENNKCNCFIGDNKLLYIGTFNPIDSIQGQVGIYSSTLAKVSNLVIETTHDVKKILKTHHTIESLKNKFKTKVSKQEGFWSYLDRDNNPDWAKIGGKYRLALVEIDDGFLILYVGGAEINCNGWTEGMIKGQLKKTIFKDHYDLIWYDSMFEKVDDESHATFDGAILTLEFPIYKSKIRFYQEIDN